MGGEGDNVEIGHLATGHVIFLSVISYSLLMGVQWDVVLLHFETLSQHTPTMKDRFE